MAIEPQQYVREFWTVDAAGGLLPSEQIMWFKVMSGFAQEAIPPWGYIRVSWLLTHDQKNLPSDDEVALRRLESLGWVSVDWSDQTIRLGAE